MGLKKFRSTWKENLGNSQPKVKCENCKCVRFTKCTCERKKGKEDGEDK